MTLDSNEIQPAVDVVIPVFGEREQALTETLSACAKQSYPISKIFVVDDGSPEPVCLPAWAQTAPQVALLRLVQDLGISAARNAGISWLRCSFSRMYQYRCSSRSRLVKNMCNVSPELSAPWGPVTRASFPQLQIACLRAGACDSWKQTSENFRAYAIRPGARHLISQGSRSSSLRL